MPAEFTSTFSASLWMIYEQHDESPSHYSLSRSGLSLQISSYTDSLQCCTVEKSFPTGYRTRAQSHSTSSKCNALDRVITEQFQITSFTNIKSIVRPHDSDRLAR